MNVLFVNNYDVSPNSGGVNRVTYTLSRMLKGHHQVNCFLAFFEDNPVVPVADFDAKIKLSLPFNAHLFEEFLQHNKIDVVQINFLKKYNVSHIPAIYNVAGRNNIPVISCFHMCPGFELVTYGSFSKLLYAFKSGQKIKEEFRNLLISKFYTLLKPFVRYLLRPKYRAQYLHSDAVVVLSPHYVAPYAKLVGTKNVGKFHSIPNMLSFDEFAGSDEIRQKQKEVLIVARLEEHTKRLSLALKIWKQVEQNAQLDDWKLIIVGAGDDEGYYRYLASKLQLNRCGFEGRQYPVPYYKRASVFMMTSSAEGWGMTLTESLQMGVVPVVFDSFGALHDIIINNKNGFIIPNDCIKVYVNKLSAIMQDSEQRMQMSLRAVDSSGKYTADNVAGQWMNLYRKLINQD